MAGLGPSPVVLATARPSFPVRGEEEQKTGGCRLLQGTGEAQRGGGLPDKRSSRKNGLTASSRGTNSRCPMPRSSSTRHAYSFTSLLLSSRMSSSRTSWDFLTGGASLAAGAGQGTPSSMSSKQVSRMRRLDLLSTVLSTAMDGEPGLGLPRGTHEPVCAGDWQLLSPQERHFG